VFDNLGYNDEPPDDIELQSSERSIAELHSLTGSSIFSRAGLSSSNTESQPDRKWRITLDTDLTENNIVIEPERISLTAMLLLVDGFLPLNEETFLNFLDPPIDSDTESSDEDYPYHRLPQIRSWARGETESWYEKTNRQLR
jgi:hypothetical protein